MTREPMQRNGYTLIEVILVMAISSMLLIGVFASQRMLAQRSQFDAAVNMMISSIGAARNEALSGVNTSGSNGMGTAACPGGPAPSGTYPYRQYVYAGTEWVAAPTAQNIVSVNFWRAFQSSQPAAVAGTLSCTFTTKTIGLPMNVRVTAPAAGARVLFVRGGGGGLSACGVTDTAATNVAPNYLGTACGGLPMTLTVVDSEGHSANIVIDASGLARRQ